MQLLHSGNTKKEREIFNNSPKHVKYGACGGDVQGERKELYPHSIYLC
jgi:hypothetical protein